MTDKDRQIIENIALYPYLCNMQNPFYNDIYEILLASGREGLPVRAIAKQVYNRHAGLFNTGLTYERVYRNVHFFLRAQSCKPSSPFMGTIGRGRYALKPDACRQMRIDFTENRSEEVAEPPEKERKATDYPTLF